MFPRKYNAQQFALEWNQQQIWFRARIWQAGTKWRWSDEDWKVSRTTRNSRESGGLERSIATQRWHVPSQVYTKRTSKRTWESESLCSSFKGSRSLGILESIICFDLPQTQRAFLTLKPTYCVQIECTSKGSTRLNFPLGRLVPARKQVYMSARECNMFSNVSQLN